MSPVGLVPFCFALLVTMSSSSENVSCSSSDGVKSSALTVRFLKPLPDRSVLRRRTVTSLSALESRSAPRENRRGVDHLHQRGERLGVAVVRGRAQEQAVLALVGQLPHGDGSLSVHGVPTSAGELTGWTERHGAPRRPRGCRRRTACRSSGSWPARTRRAAAAGRGPAAATPCCTITRGKSWNGLACSPWVRRTCAISSLLTIVKSRPNFSRISSCHFSARLGGQTITAVRARCRRNSSWMTSPASIVLPRPTSSASRRLVRGRTERATKRLELVRLDVHA